MAKNINYNLPVDQSIVEEFEKWSQKYPGKKGEKVTSAIRAILALHQIDRTLPVQLMSSDLSIEDNSRMIINCIHLNRPLPIPERIDTPHPIAMHGVKIVILSAILLICIFLILTSAGRGQTGTAKVPAAAPAGNAPGHYYETTSRKDITLSSSGDRRNSAPPVFLFQSDFNGLELKDCNGL